MTATASSPTMKPRLAISPALACVICATAPDVRTRPARSRARTFPLGAVEATSVRSRAAANGATLIDCLVLRWSQEISVWFDETPAPLDLRPPCDELRQLSLFPWYRWRLGAARAGPPAEPSNYRMEDYRAPEPATLAGARVVDTARRSACGGARPPCSST